MRIVSLVPSLTETLWDLGLGQAVVGVTKFCVHPDKARSSATVVGGTKDPDVATVLRLAPDLILADEDENKPEHLDALRAKRKVHVTRISTIRDSARELREIGKLVGRGHEAEGRAQTILERESELRDITRMAPPIRVFVPIWRKPLMTMSGATYMADMLRAAGAAPLFGNAPRKYFETTHDEVRVQEPEGVLLPTEPYRFKDTHRAEYASALNVPVERVRVIDGEALTWFGTHTMAGLDVVADAVAQLRASTVPA